MRTQSSRSEQTERRPRVGKIGSELSQAFAAAKPRAEQPGPKSSRRHEDTPLLAISLAEQLYRIGSNRNSAERLRSGVASEPATCCQAIDLLDFNWAVYGFFFWFLLSSVCIFGQGFCLHKRPNQIIYNLWENGRLTGLAVNTFEYCECAIEVNCSGFSCPCIGVCGNTFAFLILVLHISVAAAAAIELVQPPRCGI